MFRTNINSNFFLLRDEADVQDSSMTPKVGDVAELKLEEWAIDIHVKLLEKEDSNWKGAIKSYHSKGTVTTLEERYEQIKSDEKYINDNNLNDGAEITFDSNKIFGVYRCAQ